MDAVVLRAGALGDLILLRRSLAVLENAGYSTRLLAPPPADVLVGPGPASARLRLAWEGLEIAELLAGRATGGPVAAALAEADLVVAYSRGPGARELLASRAGRTLFLDPAPPPSGPHASLWLSEPLARSLATPGPPAGGAPANLRFSPAEDRAAQPLLARLPAQFLAIHPGSGSRGKNWPEDRFRSLVEKLAAGDPWLLVLGPAEVEQFRGHPGRAVVADSLPLRVLGAVLARAGLFVGNDSGVSHLAAAAGAPTLALFGPTDPAVWGPVGFRVRCLRGDPDLRAITVDVALREAAGLRVLRPGVRSAASGPRDG